MALRYTYPCFTVSRETPKSFKAVMLSTRCHAQQRKGVKIYNFSSTAITKIYEDKATGIVGHRDKNGEVIYEGLDEGPRLTHEELELINNEREEHAREHVKKLLFDTLQDNDLCVKDAGLPVNNQEMK